MKTDGYITDTAGSSGTAWEYTNLRDGVGAGAAPMGEAWARVERSGGSIPGTMVDSNGQVGSGPTVSFITANALVSSVGAPGPGLASPDNIWIQWGGVSPQSLREVLLVWSQPIVLMDPKKIKKTGGPGEIEAIRTEGRLMIIAMTQPVSITGTEEYAFTVDAGAVGFYGTKPTGTELICEQEPVITGGGGSLPSLSDPSVCSQVKSGSGGPGAGGSGGTPVTDPLLFCNQCAADVDGVQVPPQPQADGVAFAVCRGYSTVPIRCTYPFVLVELKICDGGPCETSCPVWLISYHLTGSSVPLQTFGLDKLIDIDVCNINTDQIYGVLTEDAACGDQPSVEISVMAGPNVTVTGYWRDTLPGYAGQSINFNYHCYNACGQTCVSVILPDQSQRWVTEDVIKPKVRTIPAVIFSTIGLTCTTGFIATGTGVLVTVPVISTIRSGLMVSDVSYLATPINKLTAINTYSPLTQAQPLFGPLSFPITDSSTTPVNLLTGAVAGGLVIGIGTTSIDICIGGSFVGLIVVTSVTTTPVGVLATQLTSYALGPAHLPVTDIDAQAELDVVNWGLDVPILAVTFIDVTRKTVVTDIETSPPVEFLSPQFGVDKVTFALCDPLGPNKLLALDPDALSTAPVKLLGKPLAAEGQSLIEQPVPTCAGPPGCVRFNFQVESDSGIDQSIALLTPNWVMKFAGSENNCPCYTCDSGQYVPETFDKPSGTELPPGGPVNPCTVSVKRLQRDWCHRCTLG